MRLERAISTSEICAILKQEGIYLKHLVVTQESLTICALILQLGDLGPLLHEFKESNTSARTFQKSVLPQLVHSFTSGVEDSAQA